VDSERTSHNSIDLAIFVPEKIIKVNVILTKLWRKQYCFFIKTRCS